MVEYGSFFTGLSFPKNFSFCHFLNFFWAVFKPCTQTLTYIFFHFLSVLQSLSYINVHFKHKLKSNVYQKCSVLLIFYCIVFPSSLSGLVFRPQRWSSRDKRRVFRLWRTLCIYTWFFSANEHSARRRRSARELTSLPCHRRGSAPFLAGGCAVSDGRACEETTPVTGLQRQLAFEWLSNHSEYLSVGSWIWRGCSHGWFDTSPGHEKLPVSHSLSAVSVALLSFQTLKKQSQEYNLKSKSRFQELTST